MANQLPPPFKRPGISIGRHGKVWADVPVHSVREGDMVKDHGLVKQIADSPNGLTMFFASGLFYRYSEGDIVHAFVQLHV